MRTDGHAAKGAVAVDHVLAATGRGDPVAAAQNQMCLGILVAGHHTFGREVIRGVLEYCRDHESWNIQVEGGYFENALQQVLKVITHWKDKGLIAEFWWPEQFRVARRFVGPVVEISGTWNLPGVAQVYSDHRAVGRLVARHFLERGLRQFAFHGMTRLYSSAEREAGFKEALAREGHGFAAYHDPKSRGRSDDLLEDRRALGAWLRKQTKPLGLMCGGDFRAREALLACQEFGLHVPDEVAIVGVGNDELICDISSIPISSVDVAAVRIGREAAEMIDHLRRSAAPPDRPILIAPAGVVTRQSSDVMAAENQEVVAAIRYINQHADEPIDVQNVLAHVPISRRGLEKNFKKLLGRTPQEQIFHAHVQLAQRLLVETNLPLLALALRAGFSGHSTFSIVFKRQTGLTPREYRRQFGCGRGGI